MNYQNFNLNQKINLKNNSLSFKQNLINSFLNFYKNGNKIQIKKQNIGSFTKYCNGKVTEECIKRGKNSSNPKIRKKATFAKNARSWNH